MSSRELDELIAKARRCDFTSDDQEEQRRSFAYGNTRFENEDITRDTIDAAAERLKSDAKD